MNSGTIPPPFIKQSDGTTIFNDGTNTFSDGAIKYFNGVTSFPDGSLFYADGSQLSGPNPHIALYHQTQLQQYYDFEHGLNNQYTLPRVPGYIAPMNPTVNVQGIVESYAPNPGMPQFTALPPTQTLKPMPGFMPLPDYTPVTGYMPLPSHPMAPPQNAGPLQPYQPPPPFVPQAVQDEAKKADSPELNSEHVDSHSGDYLSESTPRRITRKPSVAGSSTAALAANAISFRAQESKTETTGQIPDSAPAEDEPKPEPKPKPNPRLFAKATSPERQAAPESTKASVAPWAAQAQTTKVGRRIPVHHDTITGPVRAYVKNVKESVDANELEAYLDKFGGLVYFDVSRKKSSAFAEFKTYSGFQAAKAANPHKFGEVEVWVVEREGPEEKQERKANRSKNPFGDDKAAPAPSNDSHSMMPPPPPPLAASNPRLNAPNASLSKTDSSKSGPDRLMPPLFLTSEPGTGMSSKATTSMPHPFTPRSQWATPTGAPRGPKSMSTPSGFTPLDRNERTASNEKTSIDTGESKFVPKKKNMTRHEIDRRERWNNMGRGRRDAVSGPTGPPLEGLGNVIQQITTSFAPSPLDAAVVRQHTSHTGGAARSISVPSNHTAIPIYTAAYPPNLDPSDVGYETAIGGTDSSHAAAYGSSGNSPEASTDGAQRSDPSDPSNKDSDSDSDSKEPKKDPSPPPPPPSSPSDSSPPPPPPPPAAVNPNPDPTSFLNACDLCGDDCFCQNMFPDCLFPDQLCFCPNCTYRTARHGQPAVPGQPHQPPNSPADLTFPQPTTVAEYTAAAVALYPSPDQTPARPVHRHHRAVSNSVRISTPDGKKVERFGQDGPNFWDDIKDGKGGREDDGEDGAGAGAGAGTAI